MTAPVQTATPDHPVGIAPRKDLFAMLMAGVPVTLTAQRTIADGPARAVLTALLTEFDLTVMRRILQVTMASGASFTFEVGGRRLLRVLSMPGLADATTLSMSEDADLATLHAALRAACPDDGPVTLATRMPEGGGESGQHGVSVQALAEAWRLTPPNPAKAFPQFCEAVTGLATAWLCSEGDVVTALEGAQEEVDALATVLAVAAAEPCHGAECTILQAAAAGSALCAVARFGDTAIALLVPHEQQSDLITLWTGTMT